MNASPEKDRKQTSKKQELKFISAESGGRNLTSREIIAFSSSFYLRKINERLKILSQASTCPKNSSKA